MIQIIGAGIAGASLAYYLKDDFDVIVYEARRDVGLKPCACGVLREVEEYLKIPKDVILNEIKRCEIYLDGSKIGENSADPLGYIIDKKALIKWLLEGVDVELRRKVKPEDLPKGLKVVATGHYFHKSDKMLALQYLVRNLEVESDVMKLFWTRDFVGYYWIFPYGDLANVGVGGFLSYKELKSLLDRFVDRLNCDVVKKGSAFIYVGGIKDELYSKEDYYVIGEALGAVYPITCEGIRPSIASAYSLATAIREGGNFKEEFEKTQIPQQIQLQRKALDILVESPPELRAKYIRMMFEG